MPENAGDGCKKQGEPTMEFSLANLQPKERASFALRALYEAAGCRKYHMGRFEEYGLYQENRSFLSSEQVITFTDLDGRLLALKPDVTLSIAKTAQPAPGETLRYYYHENVYRPSAESHTFQEISQMGLEMLGAVGEAQVQQAVCLAARSLDALGAEWVLEVSHMGYLFGLFDALGVPENARPGLLEKLREKNAHELRRAAQAAGVDAARGRPAVKSAIEHGYFGADAYIDNRTDTLVVRGAAPQPKKPAQAPTPKAHPAAEDEYAALLRQLREVNDAIPDPVMSQKISRLEEVSGRIFALAQKDPDKKAQLQKFMNYYLPTALKLLNTYASLSGQAVEGTNITEAKHSIERSMDLLVTAFENQLDKLFQSDALDVSADVAALEGMLNLDGLTGSEFTR